jgi:hypothetical protein
MRRANILLFLMTLASGCSTTDDRLFVWGYISPAIFQPSCASSSCHSRAAAVAGVDLSDPDRGYASLVEGTVWVPTSGGDAADGCREIRGALHCPHARPLVVPYNPAQSRVVAMLRARNAPRMPPDRPLPEVDIELVERWILDGAPKSLSGPPPPPLDASATGDAGATD